MGKAWLFSVQTVNMYTFHQKLQALRDVLGSNFLLQVFPKTEFASRGRPSFCTQKRKEEADKVWMEVGRNTVIVMKPWLRFQ